MEKIILNFDEALRGGIRIDSRVPIGAQALETCTGLRPTAFGLKDFITITQPMTDEYLTVTLGEAKSWPFPQIFRGAAVTLLCFEDAIYEVDESTWTATEITFYDAADFGDATPGSATITAGGGAWHFIDFHITWILMNGATTIWNTRWHDKPILTEAITITTGCGFKGRALMGGFDPSDFYALADWPTWWATMDSNAPSDLQTLANTMSGGAGPNWVWWSSIGGGDLLWLVSLDLMMTGYLVEPDAYSSSTPYIHEILQRNEFGLAPLPWQGTVLHQRPLGDTVVCYGDGGISALIPHSSPAATFGIRHVQGIGANVGIANRSAVGGGIDGHVFVDRAGELWRISNSLQADRIGYGEIFSNFLDDPIVVSHDPHRNEFYIAGINTTPRECYVLTETGLGKAPWVPTQVSFADGGLISILHGGVIAAATIKTNPFGSPRDKKKVSEITAVTVTSNDTDTTGWQVTVHYRFQKGGAWQDSAQVTTDNRGVARMNVSGLEFQVTLYNADRTAADLDGVEVEMVQDGKKSLSNVSI